MKFLLTIVCFLNNKNIMKKLSLYVFLVLFFSFSVFAQELIFLNCSKQGDGGSRNISIDKEGKFIIDHESTKSFRKDETIAGMKVGSLKDLPYWIFGNDSGETYTSVSLFNYNTLEFVTAGFEKGNYGQMEKNLDKNNYFCFPINNPFN